MRNGCSWTKMAVSLVPQSCVRRVSPRFECSSEYQSPNGSQKYQHVRYPWGLPSAHFPRVIFSSSLPLVSYQVREDTCSLVMMNGLLQHIQRSFYHHKTEFAGICQMSPTSLLQKLCSPHLLSLRIPDTCEANIAKIYNIKKGDQIFFSQTDDHPPIKNDSSLN